MQEGHPKNKFTKLVTSVKVMAKQTWLRNFPYLSVGNAIPDGKTVQHHLGDIHHLENWSSGPNRMMVL